MKDMHFFLNHKMRRNHRNTLNSYNFRGMRLMPKVQENYTMSKKNYGLGGAPDHLNLV